MRRVTRIRRAALKAGEGSFEQAGLRAVAWRPWALVTALRAHGGELAVFALVFAMRFVDGKFVNDNFMHIAEARQMMHGELPIRDFFDAGFFLQVVTSYLLQLAFGYRLLPEYLFSIAVLAVAATITYRLARLASGSARIGFCAALLAALSWPRLYSYPKVFFYVLAIALFVRYERRPSRRNLALLAAATVVAFLYRHDHGVYIGLAAVVLIAAVQWAAGRRGQVLRHAGWYLGACGLLTVPFLVFVQASVGLREYVADGVAYAAAEAERTRAAAPVLAVDLSQPPVVVERRPAPPLRLRIRWVPGLSAQTRAMLEARYELARPQLIERSARGELWQYEAPGDRTDRLQQLFQDPRVRNGSDLARSMAERADPANSALWGPVLSALQQLEIRLLPGVLRAGNAVAWLYYLDHLIPVLAVGALLWGRVARREAGVGTGGLGSASVLATIVVCAVALPALLRSPLEVRLADVAAPIAVLGAWVLGQGRAFAEWLRERRSSWSGASGSGVQVGVMGARYLARVMLALLFLATVWSVATVGELGQQVQTARLLAGSDAALGRLKGMLRSLAISPPLLGLAAPPRSVHYSVLAWYVNACTRPADRLFIVGFEPELYFYADRAFAGGRVFLLPGYHDSDIDQQRTVELFERQSVPIVLADPRKRAEILPRSRIIAAYLEAHYILAAESNFGEAGARPMQVLIDRSQAPTRVYEPLGLPCFR